MIDAVHIGLHKTASTYLQKEGFASHPQIRCVNYDNTPDLRRLMFSLTRGDHTYNRTELKRCLSRIREETETSRKVVWSLENLSGRMYNGLNSQFIAVQLADIVEDTTILLVLREQYSYIKSCWCHYVREGGGLSLSQFLTLPSSPASTAPPGLRSTQWHGLYQRLIYDEYVTMLFELFGSENVNVLFFEDFCGEFTNFMRTLYELIGVEETHSPANEVILPTNQKVSPAQARVLRVLNHFSSTLHNEPLLQIPTLSTYSRSRKKLIALLNQVIPDGTINVRAYVPGSVQQRIRESNRRLANLCARKLSRIGYECD